MTKWIAGVDGCRAGWFRVSLNVTTGQMCFDLVETAHKLLKAKPRPIILCIDVPIGLPDCGGRTCDTDARRLLRRPRQSSVFSPPIRPVLNARTWEHANSKSRRLHGTGVQKQAWGLIKKIRQVDEILEREPPRGMQFVEVHPEVSFWAWNNEKPMNERKKSPHGRAARLKLAEQWLGKGILDCARGNLKKREVADDDILDAIAALWTAHRIHEGKAQVLGSHRSLDSRGRPMRIVY